MGNEDSGLKRTLEIGARRLEEYWNSKEERIGNIMSCGKIENVLRLGDIISRKLDNITESSTSRSASVSNSGWLIHYAIFAGKASEDRYYIIEKTKNEGTNNPIMKTVVTGFELSFWFLVKDSRYYDTYEMATKIMDNHLDGGYSFSHANCEHFVTFCLCRHIRFSRSRQVALATAVRDTFAIIGVNLSRTLKLASHPLYIIGGDSSLKERMIKAALPFGEGIDEDGIASGRKILIGFSVRDIPHVWYEF